MARRAPNRANDRERVARTKLDQLPSGLWKLMRLDARPDVRRVVDAAVAAGNLSLADIAHIELWQAVDGMALERDARARYDKERKRLESDPDAKPDYTAPGLNAIKELRSVALQSRKHLRTVVQAMGPGLTANDMPVVIPEGLDSEAIANVLDGIEPSEILD